MALPYSRNRTYADQVTIVDTVDMNGLQDGVADNWSAKTGLDYSFDDDFGPALDTSKWNLITGTPTFSADTGNGGYGAVSLSSSGATDCDMTTFGCNVGSKDFRAFARVRVPSMGGAGSAATMLVSSASPGFFCAIRAVNGSANWKAYNDFAIPSTLVDTDLAVAYGTTAYDYIEIRRTSGLYEFLVNGVVRHSASPSPIPSTNVVSVRLIAARLVSGTTTMLADAVKLWARR